MVAALLVIYNILSLVPSGSVLERWYVLALIFFLSDHEQHCVFRLLHYLHVNDLSIALTALHTASSMFTMSPLIGLEIQGANTGYGSHSRQLLVTFTTCCHPTPCTGTASVG
ncbi:uncharacterized protein BDW43DRAFT_82502 [Aspergillus alliaceus]|uniref:uncharacterized protein n=1 Tax=Petromyces alliaceus TaxID=209559 RepID=UPI0012A4D8F8|nr:uncharacterized protein BDW43DRAFT_82502 [Aspergillus alliaceus]KAB8233621.1 hypothetical protein BDW43DRAFT_82502 [Aspergillus alliaceus]